MPPVNDDLANATDLGSALTGTITGSNLDATDETSEPIPTNGPGDGPHRTVWFDWTPGAACEATFDTIGSQTVPITPSVVRQDVNTTDTTIGTTLRLTPRTLTGSASALADGDTAYALIAWEGGAEITGLGPTPPSGWVGFGPQGANFINWELFRLNAGASEPSFYDWTFTPGISPTGYMWGGLLAVRDSTLGQDVGTPFADTGNDATAQGFSGSNPSIDGLTLAFWAGHLSASGHWDAEAGWSEFNSTGAPLVGTVAYNATGGDTDAVATATGATGSGNVGVFVRCVEANLLDTVLAAYTGPDVATLVEIASDDDSGPGAQSEMTFSAAGGQTYHIQFSGYDDDQHGIAILNWNARRRGGWSVGSIRIA